MQISRSAFDVLHLLKLTDVELYACFLLTLDRSDLTRAGSYERNIVSFETDTQRIYTVRVLRVRRRGDMSHRTFSLRPGFLFPCSPYSVRFILSVIYHYLFTRRCCISGFVDRWQISRSTLYSWLSLFKTCSGVWFEALSSAGKTARDIRSEETSVPASPHSFPALMGYGLLETGSPVTITDIRSP